MISFCIDRNENSHEASEFVVLCIYSVAYFLIASSTSANPVDAKAFNEMYMTKIKLIDGKIDKESMEVFLRSLAFVIPPNIQLITEQTNEENDADV